MPLTHPFVTLWVPKACPEDPLGSKIGVQKGPWKQQVPPGRPEGGQEGPRSMSGSTFGDQAGSQEGQEGRVGTQGGQTGGQRRLKKLPEEPWDTLFAPQTTHRKSLVLVYKQVHLG